jgi:hypothetical protein
MSTRLGYYRKLATIGVSTGKLPAEFKPEYVLELIGLAEGLRNAAVSCSPIDGEMLTEAIKRFDTLDKFTTQYD